MLPVERQDKIKDMLTEKSTLKISELSKALGVSEMTIHRDIKPLIDNGIAEKKFGGITRIHTIHNTPQETGKCVICGNRINERLAYRLLLPTSKIETACCAHCGLIRHDQLKDEGVQAICYDFLRQTTTSATNCWFVMDTSVHIGCCQPQILPFELKEHAEKFVSGFGGTVHSFAGAMKANVEKMKESTCHEHHRM